MVKQSSKTEGKGIDFTPEPFLMAWFGYRAIMMEFSSDKRIPSAEFYGGLPPPELRREKERLQKQALMEIFPEYFEKYCASMRKQGIPRDLWVIYEGHFPKDWWISPEEYSEKLKSKGYVIKKRVTEKRNVIGEGGESKITLVEKIKIGIPVPDE